MDYHGPVTRSRARKNELAENLELRNGKCRQLPEPAAAQPGTSVKLRNTKKKIKILGNVKGGNISNEKDSDNTTGNDDMNLLDVLNNLVCRNHLLSFLQVNDLLRLRRTCKSSKNMAEDFIRTQKIFTRQKLEMDLRQENPFDQFSQYKSVLTSLPIRSTASFQLSRNEEFPLLTATFDNLLKWCASNITHLTVSYPVVPFNSELSFFGSFPNLTYLELENLRYAGTGYLLEEPVVESPYIKRNLPANLKHLKTLRIVGSTWTHVFTLERGPNAFDFLTQLVEHCMPNLELLLFPFGQFVGDIHEEIEPCIRLACMCLFKATKLKLEDLDGYFIEELLRPDNRTPEMGTLYAMIQVLKAKVISIGQPQETSFIHDLLNLEKIDFENTMDCNLPDTGFVRKEWPKLKEIKVNFCDEEDDEQQWLAESSHRQIWDFLFVGICRENVVILDICFNDENGKRIILPATDIPTSCPNLKTLCLGWYTSQYVNLPELWKGLPRLEKLRIECEGLEYNDLIGDDADIPAFWSLKNLKVLEFIVMEEMELTDEVFSKVICHMPLKELTMMGNCTGPFAHEITLNGIKSLLSGTFATTVERLSIRKLNLPGVTQEQYENVEKLFRSSQMF